jgi:hypothetical protein
MLHNFMIQLFISEGHLIGDTYVQVMQTNFWDLFEEIPLSCEAENVIFDHQWQSRS